VVLVLLWCLCALRLWSRRRAATLASQDAYAAEVEQEMPRAASGFEKSSSPALRWALEPGPMLGDNEHYGEPPPPRSADPFDDGLAWNKPRLAGSF